MVLNNLNQKELDRSVDLLITNGPLSEIQAIIEPVGYGPEGLQRLADGLYGWRANQTATTMKMLSQKQARELRDELRDLVEQLVSSFCRTAKAIFKDEPVVLRALNLHLRRSSRKATSNGAAGVEANGNDSTSVQKSKGARSLTACVTDARKLFTTALDLDEVYQQRLAEAGWDTDRLNEALEQVNALVASDNKRQEAAAARRKQQTVAKESEGALRNDYKEARELIKVAIDEADLDNEDEIKKLIGL